MIDNKHAPAYIPFLIINLQFHSPAIAAKIPNLFSDTVAVAVHYIEIGR